jgi:signal peptidase II
LFAIFIGLGFLLDRILKYFINKELPNQELFIVPRLFSLYLHQNQGMAFGINFPVNVLVIIGTVIIAAIAFALIWAIKHERHRFIYPLALIFAGGVSNLIDRALYQYTIDYFFLRPWSFFNLADLMIIAGCILALLNSRQTRTQ